MEQRLALWSKMMHVTRHALSDVSHIGISGILSAVRVLEAHNQEQELWTPPADQARSRLPQTPRTNLTAALHRTSAPQIEGFW